MNTIPCAHPECQATVKNHAWGKIKATGWFFQKDGTAWCPEHIPGWVEAWRAKQIDLLTEESDSGMIR